MNPAMAAGADAQTVAAATDASAANAFEALARIERELPLRQFRDTGGRRWWLRDSRSRGPALVLLPGAAGGADATFRLVDGLHDVARPIALTYPGDATPTQLGDGLAELLDHLGVEQVAVWGSSYGAWWAQAFAARHCNRTAALWLGNGFVDGADVAHLPLFDHGWLERTKASDVQRAWLDAVGAAPPSTLRELQRHFIGGTLSPERLRDRLLRVASARAIEPAGEVKRLVVADCADDPVIGADTRERFRARYPSARHVCLPTGGHYPHLTNVGALVPEVRRWILQ